MSLSCTRSVLIRVNYSKLFKGKFLHSKSGIKKSHRTFLKSRCGSALIKMAGFESAKNECGSTSLDPSEVSTFSALNNTRYQQYTSSHNHTLPLLPLASLAPASLAVMRPDLVFSRTIFTFATPPIYSSE